MCYFIWKEFENRETDNLENELCVHTESQMLMNIYVISFIDQFPSNRKTINDNLK